MLYIFDKDENLLEIIEDILDSDKVVRELNNYWTYEFKIDINTSENIKRKNKVGFFIDENFYLFSIEEIEDILFSDDVKNVYCQHDIYSLNDHIIEDKRCVNYTIDKALEKALEGTSYKVGECDVFDSNTINFYYISSYTALINITTLYGAEYNPRIVYNTETNILEKYVDLKVKLGVETGLRFTYDTNINEIKRTEVLDNHYNVLYGRGSSLPTTDEEGNETGGYSRLIDFSEIVWSIENGNPINKPLGQTYVEDLESIEKYGRLEGIYENKDIEDKSILLQSTYNMLQETKYPKVSYEIDVEDLSNIEGFEHYKYTLGDRVIILDDDYNINLESRIIKEQISLKDKTKIVTLGYILPSQTSEQSKGSIINPSEDTTDNKISDEDFPNTLPQVPVITVDREGFASISLVWTFENKPYYTYELYASQSENFNPTENHLIWKGHGSAFLHECGFNQTWYYKMRVTNTHGQHTDFSQEVSATTYKIKDGTEIFESAAIKEALIESLNADKIIAGKVKGTFIDARNLSVTDGNGNITFEVSSDGIVQLIQGLIKVNDEGIRINLVDSEENTLGYVLYDGQGVQIFTSEDNAISHLTREGSFIDKLVANHIKCNELMKIANRSGCPTKWYVASQATGDGTGRDEENKANSLADVLRRIRNYGLTFTEELNIYVESGNINEDIIVQDLNGTVINFNFSKGVVINTDKFVFEDNNARIALKGETNGISCTNNSITADEINSRPLIKTNNSDGLFKVRNSNYISIRGFKLCGNGGNCIENYNGSKILVYDCDMKNFDYGAYTSDMAQSCISSCRGSLGYLAYVGNGGIFSSTINIPKCSQSEIVDKRQSGIWIEETSYTQSDTLQTETTTETSTNITDSFVLTDLYTLTEGEGQAVNGRKGYVGQGRLQDFKAHRGYIELPTSSILAVLNKKDSYTLKLRMTRLNEDSGYTGKVPHPVIRAVGENIQTDYWDSNVTFDRGDTNDIVLPITISNAIKQGATRLELWAETNQEEQYSFYDNVNLIIEGSNKETTEGTTEVINDFAYADELIEKGMTYYRVCDNEYTSGQSWSQGFTYRDSNTPLSANCVAEQDVTNSMWVKVTNSNGTSTRHYKAIDCSTFVGLCLRGYSYSESPYASETLFNSFRQDRTQKNTSVSWSIAPTNEDGSCAREASNIAKYFYNLGKGIVYLKNPDTGVVEKGSIGSSEDDYSNIKKGDLIFYAKKKDGNWKQPNRFMYISHVALCYGQSSTYNKKAVIESTNVTTKKHTFADGTEVNAGIRIKQLEAYADDIVLVVRLQESHYQDKNNSTESSTEEYTNCFNETGTINGNNYVYRLKNCKITAYGGDGSSGCDIPLNLFKTCGSLNLPYGTKIYIPSLDDKKITDANGKTSTSNGIFTINDTGIGASDVDIYCSTYSDRDAEKVFGNTLREDVYVLSFGSGHGTAWSYTESYAWAYNNGTLSNYKSAFKNYIQYGGTLINFLRYKTNDKDIRNSIYWNILNS